MNDKDNPLPLKVWGEHITYYENSASRPIKSDLLENIFSDAFKPFAQAYQASAMIEIASRRGELWQLFAWGKARQPGNYRKLFMETVASEQASSKPLTNHASEMDLFAIFTEAFPEAEHVHFPKFPDDPPLQQSQADVPAPPREQSFSLADAHYTELLNVLELKNATESKKAGGLISLSMLFSHLSSSHGLGTETRSPLVLRLYASALLKKAKALDASVFVGGLSSYELKHNENRYTRWQNKLLGDKGAFTCTALLSEEMEDYARKNFQFVFNQVSTLLKPASASVFDSNPASELQGRWLPDNRVAPVSLLAGSSQQSAHQAAPPRKAVHDYNLIIPFLPGVDADPENVDANPETREAIDRALKETYRALEAIAEENGIGWEHEDDAAAAALKAEHDIKGAAKALFKKHSDSSLIWHSPEREENMIAQESLWPVLKESERVRWQLLLHKETIDKLGAAGVKAALERMQRLGSLKSPARIVLVVCGLSEWSKFQKNAFAKTVLTGYFPGTPLVLYHAPVVAVNAETGRKHLDGEAYVYRLDNKNELLLPVRKDRSAKRSLSDISASGSQEQLYPLGNCFGSQAAGHSPEERSGNDSASAPNRNGDDNENLSQRDDNEDLSQRDDSENSSQRDDSENLSQRDDSEDLSQRVADTRAGEEEGRKRITVAEARAMLLKCYSAHFIDHMTPLDIEDEVYAYNSRSIYKKDNFATWFAVRDFKEDGYVRINHLLRGQNDIPENEIEDARRAAIQFDKALKQLSRREVEENQIADSDSASSSNSANGDSVSIHSANSNFTFPDLSSSDAASNHSANSDSANSDAASNHSASSDSASNDSASNYYSSSSDFDVGGLDELIVYRGKTHTKEFLRQLKAQDFYQPNFFLSASDDKETAMDFCNNELKENEVNVIYKILRSTRRAGVHITDTLLGDGEEETVFFPGTKFSVLDVKWKEDGKRATVLLDTSHIDKATWERQLVAPLALPAAQQLQPQLVQRASDPREVNISSPGNLHSPQGSSSESFGPVLPALPAAIDAADAVAASASSSSLNGSTEVETTGPVTAWRAPLVISQPESASNYDYTIIIQIEDDAIVRETVEHLAGKHANKTLVIQYDAYQTKTYRTIYGDYGDRKALAGDKVRWIVVGHCKKLHAYGGEPFSADLQHLQQQAALPDASRVVLFACSLSRHGKTEPDSFMQRFTETAYAKTHLNDIVAYTTDVLTSNDGRRLQAGPLLEKASESRVVYRPLYGKNPNFASSENNASSRVNWEHKTQSGLNTVTRGMQGLGGVRLFSAYSNYARRASAGALTAEDKATLEQDLQLATAGMAYDIVNDCVFQPLLTRLGESLVRQGILAPSDNLIALTKQYVSNKSTLPKLMKARAGRLLLKGAPLLNVVGSGFDFYDAHRSFAQLKTEKDPELRQDLLVNGILSLLSGTIGLGTTGLLLAGSSLGIPGMLAAISLSVGGSIYNAVRVVERLEQHISLTDWERFTTGLGAMVGAGPSVSVENKLIHLSSKEQARAHYDAQLAAQAERIITSGQADIVHYVRGQFDMEEQTYKCVQNIKYYGAHFNVTILEDKILPEEAKNKLMYYRNRHSGETVLEDSEHKYYTPKPLLGQDSIINIPDNQLSSSDKVRTLLAPRQQQLLGTFVNEQGQPLFPNLEVNESEQRALLGDFNGDQHADIACLTPQGLYVALANNNKEGGYQPPKLAGPASLIEHNTVSYLPRLVADINQDGRDDILMPGRDLSVQFLVAQEDGTFVKECQTLIIDSNGSNNEKPHSALVSDQWLAKDIDSDGLTDLMLLNNKQLHIWYGKSAGKFEAKSVTQQTPWWTGSYPHLLAGDVNGDGHTDIVLLDKNDKGKVKLLMGQGSRKTPFIQGREQAYAPVKQLYDESGFKESQFQLHDLNGDGCADLMAIRNDGSYTVAHGIKGDKEAGSGLGPLLNQGLYPQTAIRHHADSLHPLAIRGQEHILGMVTQDKQTQLLSLNKQGEIKAHPLNQKRPEQTRAWFMQEGSYNSEFVGYADRQNIFVMGEGRKKFTGGNYSDSFLLLKAPEPELPSVLNGAGGEDWLVVSADKNYHIDLQQGYLKLSGKEKTVAQLVDIEHIEGHADSDHFIGDGKNNKLLGKGGEDHLEGGAGNDTLSLQAGSAQGGTGSDLYHILSNANAQDVILTITEPEGDTLSYIRLEQRLDANATVHLSDDKRSVQLTLSNDNGSKTLVHLKEAYLQQGDTLQRRHDFRLYS